MPEENKPDLTPQKPKIKATTKDQSIFAGLGKYALETYIVPKTKDVLHDAFAGFLSMANDALQGSLNKAFYGEDKPRNRTNNGSTNYTSYYTKPQSGTQTYGANKQSVGQRSSTEVKMIWVDDEESANEIVNGLKDLINQYGKAKVADLYELLDPPPKIVFTDYEYGWTDGSQITYRKEYTGENRNKYFIDLPKPINVKDV